MSKAPKCLPILNTRDQIVDILDKDSIICYSSNKYYTIYANKNKYVMHEDVFDSILSEGLLKAKWGMQDCYCVSENLINKKRLKNSMNKEFSSKESQ